MTWLALHHESPEPGRLPRVTPDPTAVDRGGREASLARGVRLVRTSAFGLLMMAAAAVSPAGAQSRTTSALAGRVTDETGAALPGAVAQIAGPALIGGPRSAPTDAQGRFRFAEIPPGRYRLTVTMTGYRTAHVDGVPADVGSTAEIAVPLSLYAGEETVRVQAPPLLIDRTSSAAPTILPSEILRNIPTDRDPTHILDLAPGINLESAYGAGEEAGNAYELDGVDISDPEQGAPWSLFNYSLFEEVQLVGLGAPAEYGGFTGVVFNSVTRSGGNEPSGSAELYYTDRNLTSSSSSGSDVASTVEGHTEASVQQGGPLVEDRLWYFVSGQYERDRSSEGGPIEATRSPKAFGKLTWQATPKDTIRAWLQWDRTRVTGRNGDAFTPLEATAGEDDPEVVWNVSWRSAWSSSSILDLAWAGFTGTHRFDPHNGFAIAGRVDAESDVASDNPALFQKYERTRNQLKGSLTHHAAQILMGDHDLKVGFDFSRSRLHNLAGFPGGAFFSDHEGPVLDPSTGMLDTFTLGFHGGGYETRPTAETLSLYAQDAWGITPRFTLNPGLRLDVNRGRAGGRTVFRTHPLAPRLGFAWDLAGDATSVLKGHYGRYYEALYSSFYQYAEPGAFGLLTQTRTFDTSGFMDTLAVIPSPAIEVDSRIRQPYLDQFVLSYDREIASGVVASGTLVYRKNRNFIEIVSPRSRFVPITGTVPGSGRTLTLFDDVATGPRPLLYTNPGGLDRSYKAAILSVTRRMSRGWQLMASYVHSRARGNVDNLGFDTTPPDTDQPDLLGQVLQTPNTLVNSRGRLTHDQTHQVKLEGTWTVPAVHLSLSADYVFHSGDTWTPTSDCLLTDDGNGVLGDGVLGCHTFPQGAVTYLAEPRGSRRLPSRSELDLRGEWTHAFAAAGTLRVFADVFNVTNQARATEVEPSIGDELGHAATVNFPRSVRLGLGFDW